MPKGFNFTPIEGMLSLEEATEQLVHLAKCIQRTHTFASASNSKAMAQGLFDSRKAGVTALMNLIQDYIHQMPEPGEENAVALQNDHE